MDQVRAYAGAFGVQPSTVVQRAARLGGGVWAKWEVGEASPTLRTADKILKYMRENPVPLPSADADALGQIKRAS